MSKKEIIVQLANLMVVLLELDGQQPVPASSLYLALNCDMEAYQTLTGVGERMGWLRVTSTTLALTDKGAQRAEAFNLAFKEAA